jgi:hypothetical protein
MLRRVLLGMAEVREYKIGVSLRIEHDAATVRRPH